MKALITGANGQLGSEMRHLSREFPTIECLFTDVAELDITNPEAIAACVQDFRPDVIINCAAYTAVDRAEGDPELCDRLNHVAPGHLATAAASVDAAFVQISTDYVFDGTACRPYTEDGPTNPTSVYGRTKLAGELAAQAACPKTMIVRTAWLYSTFGNNFVKTMTRLGRERDHIGVVFDQVGTPTYARDLARALFTAIRQGVQPGIYHYSNEGVCSWYDFTLAIHRLAGIRDCHVDPLHTADYPTPAARPHYSVLDKTKIKQTYSISIPHWTDSLRQYFGNL